MRSAHSIGLNFGKVGITFFVLLHLVPEWNCYKKTAWDISPAQQRGTGIPIEETRKAHALRERPV